MEDWDLVNTLVDGKLDCRYCSVTLLRDDIAQVRDNGGFIPEEEEFEGICTYLTHLFEHQYHSLTNPDAEPIHCRERTLQVLVLQFTSSMLYTSMYIPPADLLAVLMKVEFDGRITRPVSTAVKPLLEEMYIALYIRFRDEEEYEFADGRIRMSLDTAMPSTICRAAYNRLLAHGMSNGFSPRRAKAEIERCMALDGCVLQA